MPGLVKEAEQECKTILYYYTLSSGQVIAIVTGVAVANLSLTRHSHVK